MSSARVAEVVRSIAANVRRVRDQRHWTQEDLADAADLDLTFVQRVESATANASVRTLVKIASALEIEPWTLLKPATFSKPPRGRPRKKRE